MRRARRTGVRARPPAHRRRIAPTPIRVRPDDPSAGGRLRGLAASRAPPTIPAMRSRSGASRNNSLSHQYVWLRCRATCRQRSPLLRVRSLRRAVPGRLGRRLVTTETDRHGRPARDRWRRLRRRAGTARPSIPAAWQVSQDILSFCVWARWKRALDRIERLRARRRLGGGLVRRHHRPRRRAAPQSAIPSTTAAIRRFMTSLPSSST